jgi:outer membrane receptor protein involved in Fe transport
MKKTTWAQAGVACLHLSIAASALADDASNVEVTTGNVEVTASKVDFTGIGDTSSEGVVTGEQLKARPLLRPAEVMESVPGLIVTQHSGDGKANQYFLRGFNLDHGSDFATRVNGAPVNNVTHAHGQGYMDLNFLIPELVDRVRYRKGPYAAEDGDLAVTGSARIDYVRRLPAAFADITVGERQYRRALAAGSTEVNGINLLGAIELAGNDGPWEQPENLEKRNAVLRLSSGTDTDGYALTAMIYKGDWTASEQVPERAIDSGEIGRYDTFADTDGGKTHRYSLTGNWSASDAGGITRASAYVVDYELNLFSTPSGFLDGQHEQADRRITWGGEAAREFGLGERWLDTQLGFGLQWRQDRIGRVGLYQTVERQRVSTVREDRVTENSLGLYAEARTAWQPWLRTTAGLRWDHLNAHVKPLSGAFNDASNGGDANAHQLSPKLGVVLGPFGSTEFYANWGRGFHSNDARGATASVDVSDGTPTTATPLIVKATGSEIGARFRPLPRWLSSVTLWHMELDSELIYVGDSGVTEPKGGSRRYGLEWSNHYSNGNGLLLDGDIALSHARFTEDDGAGTHVPNAVPLTASFSATWDRNGDWFGGVRLRYLGAYPLEESGREESSSFWTTNLKVGYRVDKSLQFTVDVLNLFNSQANDIEYFGASCTAMEGAGCGGGEGIEGRLLHPLEPRTLRLGARFTF